MWYITDILEHSVKKMAMLTKETDHKYSFDRIDDDLCEVLLSYLSLEQKFRFECVSKQFKRCVYQRQNQLKIDLIQSS